MSLTTKFRIISWNTAKRLKQVDSQIAFLEQHDPDVVALQEIIPSTEFEFKNKLTHRYPYQVSSFDLAPDLSKLENKRMFGQLVLSKFPVEPLNPEDVDVPWPERVLSCVLTIDQSQIVLHTTHIPPGSSNGWIKIQMIKGLVQHLIGHSEEREQILCGDFNTPKFESSEDGLVTFGQSINKKGNVSTKKSIRGGRGDEWDAVERSLFEDLPRNGLIETFRVHHPNDFTAFSWQFSRQGKQFARRFDHIFASKKLKSIECSYVGISSEMSDHSPITATFQK